MIKKKYGKIVNITSQSAVIATKAHAACEWRIHTHENTGGHPPVRCSVRVRARLPNSSRIPTPNLARLFLQVRQ